MKRILCLTLMLALVLSAVLAPTAALAAIFLVKYELFFLILRRAPVPEDVSGVGVRVVE